MIDLATISAILDELDPEGFIGGGAKPGHYRAEARTLLLTVQAGRTISAEHVRDVWLYWFGCCNTPDGAVEILPMPMRAVHVEIARRVNEALRR